MKKTFTVLVALYIAITTAIAQKEANIWYFGEFAGLNFNSGSPVALTNSAMNTQEGCTSVSDANGNLLFYSDGITVWNRNHQAMVNGTGLTGHKSSFQSAIAVPQPGSTTIYYLFTVDAIENNLVNGLRYSIVDMSLAGGLGAVTTKNVLLATPVTERLTVVRHENNTDYWIVVHKWDSNAFLAHLVTSSGVNPTAVTSTVGVIHSGSMLNAVGAVKASPNGNRLALGIRGMSIFEVFNFNKTTGQVSNAITSPAIFPNSIGVEFSPDGTKLYGAVAQNGQIYQFDLNQTNFFSKGILIGTSANFTCALQIGPDGKIYSTRRQSNYIGVITNPNTLGIASNYVDDGVFLGSGRLSWFGLPNFIPNLFFKAPITTFNFTNTCFTNTTAFTIPGDITGYTFTWNFADPASGAANTATGATPTHQFTATGTYKVKLEATLNGVKTIIEKDVIIKPLPIVNLGNDFSLCAGQTHTLSVNPEAGATYLWQNGSTGTSFTVTQAGTYWLEATKDGCKVRDEITIDYKAYPVVRLGNDTTLCAGKTLLLNAKNPGLTYVWQDGSINQTFEVKQAGTYWVDVRNATGCTTRGTIQVQYQTYPVVNLGADTTICAGKTLVLNAKNPGMKYKWQDGKTTATYTVSAPGDYFVDVENSAGCITRDVIKVMYQANPGANLGRDTVLCVGSTLLLDAKNAGMVYSWQDGSSGRTFTVSAPGTFWVDVKNSTGCVTRSAINVQYVPFPVVNLGPNVTLCAGTTLTLDAQNNGMTYQWQNGSTARTYQVNAAGTYWVDVKNAAGCVTRGTISVQYENYPVVNLGRDTTICEGKTLLLNAKNNGMAYTWQDGSTNQTLTVATAGTYWVDVRNNTGCITRDSIKVFYLTPPVVNLGKDTTLCQGQSLILSKSLPGANYLWQDGSTHPTLTVTKPGKYWLRASIDVCSESDTILVQFQANPPVVFKRDTVLCTGTTMLLTAAQPGATYKWQDGSTASTFMVDKAGTYAVIIKQNYCTTTSTINITYQDCIPFIPNVISPNGDNLNETFSIRNVDIKKWGLEIYNRWGKLIYKTNSYNNEWNGKEAVAGVYFYKFTNPELKTAYKGYLEVVK